MPITIESIDDLLLMIGAKEAEIMVLRKAEAKLQDRISNLEKALDRWTKANEPAAETETDGPETLKFNTDGGE